jgi:hypothetical protein
VSEAPLAEHIDSIERAYEYLLAYAAQGRQEDAGTEARAMLEQLHAALGAVGGLAQAAFADSPAQWGVADYLNAVQRDAQIARGAVGLVLSREHIGSLLVDNLNASVHLRAVLTDVFLLEQALKT